MIKSIDWKGRWVFADKNLMACENIEICETIHIPDKDIKNLQNTILEKYLFANPNWYFIALGNWSLYNHSEYPNASAYFDEKRSCWIFYALQDIKKGDEITINYWANLDFKAI